MKERSGFTLIEVMTSVAILTIVAGVLFALASSMSSAAELQETKSTTQDEVRAATDFIVRELRQAARATITGLPGAAITYRRAEDVDGNGVAVDAGGRLELGALRTIQRDTNDVNGDGQTLDQLVMVTGGTARVITNGLLLNEDTNGDGVLGGSEDQNGNGVLDRGLWFEDAGPGIRVTLQAQRRAGARGILVSSTLVEILVPRN